jgi:uncharacterized protein with GYD domain
LPVETNGITPSVTTVGSVKGAVDQDHATVVILHLPGEPHFFGPDSAVRVIAEFHGSAAGTAESAGAGTTSATVGTTGSSTTAAWSTTGSEAEATPALTRTVAVEDAALVATSPCGMISIASWRWHYDRGPAIAANRVRARFGAKVTATYWTMGAFDGVLIFEAPDDEKAAALLHHLGSKGAVRTRTLRAFDAKSTQSILSTLAGGQQPS